MADEVAALLSADGGFPNDAIFNSLLPLARSTHRTIVCDPSLGVDVGYGQFMTDVIHMRHMLRQRLSSHFSCDSTKVLRENALIPILAPANYEFAVAALAILAIGGVIVPLRKCSECYIHGLFEFVALTTSSD